MLKSVVLKQDVEQWSSVMGQVHNAELPYEQLGHTLAYPLYREFLHIQNEGRGRLHCSSHINHYMDSISEVQISLEYSLVQL